MATVPHSRVVDTRDNACRNANTTRRETGQAGIRCTASIYPKPASRVARRVTEMQSRYLAGRERQRIWTKGWSPKTTRTYLQMCQIAKGVQHGHHRHHRQHKGQHITEAQVVVDVAEQHQHQHEGECESLFGGNDEDAALREDDGSMLDLGAEQPNSESLSERGKHSFMEWRPLRSIHAPAHRYFASSIRRPLASDG